MSLDDDKPFLISPPFGTWFNHPRAYSVLGSFTERPRPGRLGQILRTVRPVEGGWINKIGLRNPGMWSLTSWREHQIPSLAPIDGDPREWQAILDYVLYHRSEVERPLIVEVNVSCPNTNHPVPALPTPTQLRKFVDTFNLTTIFKLQPLPASIGTARRLAESGAAYVHLSNTLPSPDDRGGVSGRQLLEANVPIVAATVNAFARSGLRTEVIAGGGIYEPSDLERYALHGVRRFAIGTGWVWPPRARYTMKSFQRVNGRPVIEFTDRAGGYSRIELDA